MMDTKIEECVYFFKTVKCNEKVDETAEVPKTARHKAAAEDDQHQNSTKGKAYWRQPKHVKNKTRIKAKRSPKCRDCQPIYASQAISG